MKKLLTTLRKKPERVREQIALAAASSVTLIIVIVWALSLGNPFSSSTTVAREDDSVQPQKPLQLFFSSISSGLRDKREELQQIDPFATSSTATMEIPINEENTGEQAITGFDETSPAGDADTIQDTTQIDSSKEESTNESVVQ